MVKLGSLEVFLFSLLCKSFCFVSLAMPFEVTDQRGVPALPHFFEDISFSSQVFVVFAALNYFLSSINVSYQIFYLFFFVKNQNFLL